MAPQFIPLETRFQSLVGPPDKNGCLPWLGSISRSGYGQIKSRGKVWRAHRLAWELAFGPIPDATNILHHCDNRPCVNPAHLFSGGHPENVADRHLKNRDARGEAHGMHKLTVDQVLRIRAEYDPPECSLRVLAEEFGVSKAMVGYIVRRQNWKHV
jgi:hypothetical protein